MASESELQQLQAIGLTGKKLASYEKNDKARISLLEVLNEVHLSPLVPRVHTFLFLLPCQFGRPFSHSASPE